MKSEFSSSFCIWGATSSNWNSKFDSPTGFEICSNLSKFSKTAAFPQKNGAFAVCAAGVLACGVICDGFGVAVVSDITHHIQR